MFSFIKQTLIALLRFSKSLATKCVPLNNESCMIRSFPIDLSLVELKYYPFMISLDKHNGFGNSINNLSMGTCVPSKAKEVNVKAFNMITNRN